MQKSPLAHTAISLYENGLVVEAIDTLSRAIAENPHESELYYQLGHIFKDQRAFDKAAQSYIKVLSLTPHHSGAYTHLGVALKEMGRFERAIESYQKALHIDPKCVEASIHLGIAWHDMREFERAIEAYKNALALEPNMASLYYNLGNSYYEKGECDNAIEAYFRALELKPQYASAYTNLAIALKSLGKVDEAILMYEKALALQPNATMTEWNLALAYLVRGDLVEGFKRYEYRWNHISLKGEKRFFKEPQWVGDQPLEGKTILIHSEQGFGDTLQFCRYIPLLEQMGAKVLFEVETPLIRLLLHLSRGVHLFEKGTELPSFDYHSPLLSLPYAFKTTLQSIPSSIPYLEVEKRLLEQWGKKLSEKRTFRVGLVWSGAFRADQPEVWSLNTRRNISFEMISRLNRHDVDFYSLQKGEIAESELIEQKPKLWQGDNFFNYMDEVKDFADTAALIMHLDLIICVDTSTAHLAGALGKEVWLLNRFDTCWRWMLHREDTPWYPTLRLFRQSQWNFWDDVITRVQNALNERIHMLS